MATSDEPPIAARPGLTNDKLTRFANVLGASIVGLLVTALLLWFFAATLRLSGGGLYYTFIFILATGLAHQGVKRATAALPVLRIAILVAGLGAIAVVSASWRQLGFEDPFVAPMIFTLFLAIGYWFTAPKSEQPEPLNSELDEQLARAEPAATDDPHAVVSLYRKSRLFGGDVNYYVSCDDKPIAKLENGRFATVKVPAGEHVFTLSDGSGTVAPITVTLNADEETYIDCTFSSIWSGVTLKTVPPTEGRREIAALEMPA